jgi:hypothetical protein
MCGRFGSWAKATLRTALAAASTIVVPSVKRLAPPSTKRPSNIIVEYDLRAVSITLKGDYMDNMTLEDLRVSMQNFLPSWVEIATDEYGQIVIYTNLKEGEDGFLVEIDD